MLKGEVLKVDDLEIVSEKKMKSELSLRDY
jgi:hypothetical protein